MLEPLNSTRDKSHLVEKHPMQYEGETINGVPHGLGKLASKKLEFECVGSFENGALHGPALFTVEGRHYVTTMR